MLNRLVEVAVYNVHHDATNGVFVQATYLCRNGLEWKWCYSFGLGWL